MLPCGIPLKALSKPRFFPKVPPDFLFLHRRCASEDPRSIGPGLSLLLGSSVK
jgi:hypothetical protein